MCGSTCVPLAVTTPLSDGWPSPGYSSTGAVFKGRMSLLGSQTILQCVSLLGASLGYWLLLAQDRDWCTCLGIYSSPFHFLKLCISSLLVTLVTLGCEFPSHLILVMSSSSSSSLNSCLRLPETWSEIGHYWQVQLMRNILLLLV